METYGDLGLRIPFHVQLKAYNQRLEGELESGHTAGNETAAVVDDDKKLENMRILYRSLAREGVLHDANGKCKHTECDDNLLQISEWSGGQKSNYRWCNYDLSREKAQRFSKLRTEVPLSTSTNLGENSWRYANVFQGMATLQDLDNRIDTRDGRQSEIADTQAAAAQKARGEALGALARTHGPTSCDAPSGTTKKPYLQRHRYQLPRDRAERFATTTGPWEDSGMMPEPVPTMRPGIENQHSTTTGAMMEFLGGDIGQYLPFSADAATSAIPLLADTGNYDPSTTSAQEEAMIRDIDKLIAETTTAQSEQPIAAEAFPTAMSQVGGPNDVRMEHCMLDDMDMDFDTVFDMSLDEPLDLTNWKL